MSVFRYREPSTSRHSERVHYTAGYNSGCTRAAAPQLAQQQQRVRSVDETPKQQQQRTYAIRPQRCSNFAPKKSYGALKDWCFHCGIHYDLHVWSEPPSTKTGRQESPAPQASPPPRGSPTQAYFALSPELGRPGTAVQSSNADLDGLTPSELKALLVRCVRIDYFPSLFFLLKTNNRPPRGCVTLSLSLLFCTLPFSSRSEVRSARARALQCEGEAAAMAQAANCAVSSAVATLSDSYARLQVRSDEVSAAAQAQLRVMQAGLDHARADRNEAEARAAMLERERVVMVARR